MNSFFQYYNDLQRWEGLTPKPLIATWPPEIRNAISDSFQQSVSSSNIIGLQVPIRSGSSNQSIGNQVEKFFIDQVSPCMRQFVIDPCSGSGYPDKTLRSDSTGETYPLEFKATSSWNPKDSNRRVLTSSSKKLRRNFAAPIYHLLATVIYSDSFHIIEHFRLDFLEPGNLVNVRLEASVNHKLLSEGLHYHITI